MRPRAAAALQPPRALRAAAAAAAPACLISRPPPVSLRSKLGRQRFRVRISPKDERIRVANAQLTVLTEPLKSVTKLDRRAPPVDTRVPAGGGVGGSAPLPNLAAPSSIDPPYNPAAANAAAAYRSMSAVEPETASSPPLAAPLALQPPAAAAAAAMAAAGAGAAGGGSEELRQQLSDSYSLLSRERAERAAMEQRLALQARPHDRPPARRLHARRLHAAAAAAARPPRPLPRSDLRSRLLLAPQRRQIEELTRSNAAIMQQLSDIKQHVRGAPSNAAGQARNVGGGVAPPQRDNGGFGFGL